MTSQKNGFYSLLPSQYLDSIEQALVSIGWSGQESPRSTGRVLALNSIENRVIEVEMEDAPPLIAKFYRPGRWTLQQIVEEHAFLLALQEAEVPVAAPLLLQTKLMSSKTLGQFIPLASEKTKGASVDIESTEESPIYFALFEKKIGRHLDEWTDSELRQAGRYLARIHAVGKRLQNQRKILTRNALTTHSYGRVPLDRLKADIRFQESAWGNRYLSVVKSVIESVENSFSILTAHSPSHHLVHGDCHFGNLLWPSRPPGGYQDSQPHTANPPYFLDFDDCLFAPAVQDIWMMTRGRDKVALEQREVLLEGYELMQPFDRQTLEWIEPLRALRMIHFAGWIAARWEDPSFPRLFPDFASERWLQTETEALLETQSLFQ